MKYKALLYFSMFTNVLLFGQDIPGKIKLKLQDRLTGEILSSKTFTLVLNDTENTILTTDSDGSILTKELPVGKYKVEIKCENYQSQYMENIILGIGKTSYLTYSLIPNRHLSRKERKKMGLK